MKRYVTVLALYAVALHVVLAGFAPAMTGAAADPSLVICHSDVSGSAPESSQPVDPRLLPGRACDHCNLCSAAAPPDVANLAPAAILAPPQVLAVLHPVSVAYRDGTKLDARRARGPPSFV